MSISTYCQTKEKESKFNFDFERVENNTPIGWTNFGSQNYTISIDSNVFKSGKNSVSIKFNEKKQDYKAIQFVLPNNYKGNKITLSGYIKTENVSNGYAGLWMRIDPGVGFDNMNNRGITGTTNWKKYKITLKLTPFKTQNIVIGAILSGKGKIWIDDLSITIDGEKIENAKPFILPAKKDKEFDSGSQISIISLEKSNIDNLKTLGLVWGFLKYYHPNIAKGDFNWDYELFRILPKFQNISSHKERDEILVKWINYLGPFQEPIGVSKTSQETKMKPDLDWVLNSKFSSELTTLLLKIKIAKRTDNHYYISLLEGVGNPIFTNENPYSVMKFPDTGFRILALYRYWNIIQYYFPYKYLIGEDWKNVLNEFIPKIISSKNKTEYTLTILELIGRINDSHANIWGGNKVLNNYKGLNYAAINLTFIENNAVVTYFNDDKVRKETGLQLGDVISKINNQSVDNIVKNNLKYTPASNYTDKLRDIAFRTLLRTNDTILNIEYIRDNQQKKTIIKTNSLNKAKIWNKNFASLADTCFKLVSPKIAYINNGSFKSNYISKIKKELKMTEGIIIDCRLPPFHAPLDSLCDYLYPKKMKYAKFTKGSIKNPGLFTFGHVESAGKENLDYYKGKVIILVNEQTQSASEYHVMAYQKVPNSIVIGSNTAGADGNVSQIFYLPGKIMTMITGIGVYYPNGKETQRTGIIPDIETKPTIEGIKNGRDELIEKAIEIINRK